MIATILVSIFLYTTSATANPCITSCIGLPNGNYQSCQGCQVYASCVHDQMIDNRPCAQANTYWDDNKKICDWSSNTCPYTPPTTTAIIDTTTTTTTTTTTPPTSTINIDTTAVTQDNSGSICVSSCIGVLNGNYQSCQGCNVYVSCVHGSIIENRPCAKANTVWDDNKKICDWTSDTCPENNGPKTTQTIQTTNSQIQTTKDFTTTNTVGQSQDPCISSCIGLKDGHYQSCQGCQVYASCVNENIYDNRACAQANTYWDNNKKICDWVSDTCPHISQTTTTTAIKNTNTPTPIDITTTQTTTTVNSQNPCITSCIGVPNGNYQSCNGCQVFASCVHGQIIDDRACAKTNTYWDDNKKICDWKSDTCPYTPTTTNIRTTNTPTPIDITTTQTHTTTKSQIPCITSCVGLPNGNYQSCNGCQVFASCVHGSIVDNRACAQADTVWDDNKKICDWTSDTCTEPPLTTTTTTIDNTPIDTTPTTTQTTTTSNNNKNPCISSCIGVPNGNYQSCLGCQVFASCVHGSIIDNRACAKANTYWDDNKKICDWKSDTCPHTPTTTNIRTSNTLATPTPIDITTTQTHTTTNNQNPCITSCIGVPNGNYQSCNGCQVFASCVHGSIIDNRACAKANTYWDDNKKICDWKSETCPYKPTNTPTPIDTTTTATTTAIDTTITAISQDPICITSCVGLKDGDYQSCKGCQVYASCVNEQIYDSRACAQANTYWDDNKKICDYTSDTCPGNKDPQTTVIMDRTTQIVFDTTTVSQDPCIRSCTGLIDGDYQSCVGCDVYASCVSESITDNRECPGVTVWDDNKKGCDYSSDTCGNGGGSNGGSVCITDCNGLINGDYQSCEGCNVYASCVHGYIYDNRPCPAGLFWDDNKKNCQYTSDTCNVGGSGSGNALVNEETGDTRTHSMVGNSSGTKGIFGGSQYKFIFYIFVIIGYMLY